MFFSLKSYKIAFFHFKLIDIPQKTTVDLVGTKREN